MENLQTLFSVISFEFIKKHQNHNETTVPFCSKFFLEFLSKIVKL